VKGTRPPSLEKRRSPAANSLFDVIGFVYTLALTIVLTPVILHYIGTEQYGLFALATVLVSFLGLIDFGMTPVVLRFLSASLATSDHAEARSVVGTGIVFFFAVGLAGGATAVASGFFLVPAILSLSPGLDDIAAFVMSVAGVGFFFSMLQRPVAAIAGALQRYDVLATARIVSTSVGAGASVLVLWLGFGLKGLMVVTALQSALTMTILAWSRRRLLPTVPLRPAWHPALLKSMLSFSGYSFVSNLAGSLLFHVDKFLLGALTNVSIVSYYVVPGNLARRLLTGVTRLVGITLPVSTDLHTRGEKEALDRFYVRATRVVALVTVSFALPAFILSREILLEWVGSEFAATSFGTLRLLILTFAALSLAALPYYLTHGFGRPQVSAAFNVVTALINLVLIVILIPSYGLVGAAVAYLASTATVPFLIVFVERRMLELQSSPWPSLLARLSIVAGGQTATCLLLRPFADGLPQLLGVLGLCVVVAPVLALATGYITPQDRATIRRLVPAAQRLRAPTAG
jgi:O-antigen/teichoic acid export membrane protein